MSAILFEEARPVATVSPNRADLPCFIGFVQRRATAVPDAVKDWLPAYGWRDPGTTVADFDKLLHTPIPVENFETFHRLFAWETRPGADWATWLGAAVRSFFAQGGARCFVVRAGDPSDLDHPENAGETLDRMRRLLPGFSGGVPSSIAEREDWRGIEVLHGLEEAAFVCLPDLPELVADAALPPVPLQELPASPEEFVECGPVLMPPVDAQPAPVAGPACTAAGFARWFEAAHAAAEFLRRHRQDMHAILAVPLAAEGTLPQGHLLRVLLPPKAGLAAAAKDEPKGLASAFLQLVHPWLGTDNSAWLPGGLEPPDGVFAGAAARTVATQGVHRSLGRQPLRRIHRFFPPPAARDHELLTAKDDPTLIQRVSLLGETPDGPRILSDVTTSLTVAHRPACVGRLTAAILRTARRLGEEVVFDAAGPALWRKIERRLDSLLDQFFRAGALLGQSPGEAYSVRCDATTMSQNDLDNGRVLAVVSFAPAHPIGVITVTLALREGEPLTAAAGA